MEARRGRGVKKSQQRTKGSKTSAEKIDKNYKKNPQKQTKK
jgi:hypothetical protein